MDRRQNIKIIFVILLCIFSKVCFAGSYPNFDQNPYLSSECKKAIKPYLLPENSLEKTVLDQIFGSFRATHDDQSLLEAGFTILHNNTTSKIRVVKHSLLPGYLIKLYLDTLTKTRQNKPEWYWFVKRCEGVQKIAKIIKKEKIEHFTVPKKWIYPLPISPIPHLNAARPQWVVLLVEDMNILNEDQSREYWFQNTNKKILDELYKILRKGYGSCYLCGNVPFSLKAQKFVFIDTEKPKRKLELNSVKNFLSPEMGIYWDQLIQ